jgi:hypothetical protein
MRPPDGVLREGRATRDPERRRTRRWLHALRDHLVAPPTPLPEEHDWAPPAATAPGAVAPPTPLPEELDSAPPAATAPRALAPPVIAVIADRRDIAPLAAGVALLTAAAHRAPCGVVVLDDQAAPAPAAGDDHPRTAAPLAAPAARRLWASLAARGVDARAAGRLVTAGLPPADEPSALAATERTLAAAGAAGAATVIGLGTPRAPGLDRALAACDLGLILVRPGQERVLDLAIDDLAAARIPARGAAARVRPSARLLTTRGLAVPPSLRATLAPLLAGGGAEEGA